MRGGMEVTIVKKKGGPGAGRPAMDDDSMVEDAIREVAGRIDNYDTDNLMGSYREKMSPEEGPMEEMSEGETPMSKEECPDCAKGECMNPEHMDEDMLRSMLMEKGEE